MLCGCVFGLVYLSSCVGCVHAAEAVESVSNCCNSEKSQVKDDSWSDYVRGLATFVKRRLSIVFAYLCSSIYFSSVRSSIGGVWDIFTDDDGQNFKKFAQTLNLSCDEYFRPVSKVLYDVDLLIEKGWFKYFLEKSPDEQVCLIGYSFYGFHFYDSKISDTIVISHEDHEGGVHELQIPRDEFRSFIRSVNRG